MLSRFDISCCFSVPLLLNDTYPPPAGGKKATVSPSFNSVFNPSRKSAQSSICNWIQLFRVKKNGPPFSDILNLENSHSHTKRDDREPSNEVSFFSYYWTDEAFSSTRHPRGRYINPSMQLTFLSHSNIWERI